MKDIMKGISPLPWKNDEVLPTIIRDADGLSLQTRAAPYNVKYTIHAANLYPELVDALEEIAKQKTLDEINPDYFNDCDFEGAYEQCVLTARAILAKCKAGE